MDVKRFALIGLFGSFALSGCKLGVSVFEGGSVQSTSGAYQCSQGQACVIEIPDTYFHDTFVAVPDAGYQFERWTKGDGFHCGGSTNPQCVVSTTNLRGDEAWEDIIAGDGYMYLSPQFKYVGGGAAPKPKPEERTCITSPQKYYYSHDDEIVMRNGTTIYSYNSIVINPRSQWLIFQTAGGDSYGIEDWGERLGKKYRLDVTRTPDSCFTPSGNDFVGTVKRKYTSDGITYIADNSGEVAVQNGTCSGISVGNNIIFFD